MTHTTNTFWECDSINKIEKHQILCDQLHHTFKVKNEAYGDSFSKSIEKYGYIAAIIRMEDKLNRMDSLLRGARNEVEDESLADTLLDLSNYFLMMIMELATARAGNKPVELYKEADIHERC